MWRRQNLQRRSSEKNSRRTSNRRNLRSLSSQPFRKSRSNRTVQRSPRLAFALALMAGAGLTFVAEVMDKGIRRSSDIFGVVDSQLIVSIPYIVTAAEMRRRKRRIALLMLVFRDCFDWRADRGLSSSCRLSI